LSWHKSILRTAPFDLEYWEDYSEFAGNVRHRGAGRREREFDGRDYRDKTLCQKTFCAGLVMRRADWST
jgi:hypothetical protein